MLRMNTMINQVICLGLMREVDKERKYYHSIFFVFGIDLGGGRTKSNVP